MTLEQKRNIAITIRLSESEAETLNCIAKTQHQTKTAVLVTALTMYAQSLTAADTAPREISPETVTGAKETPTETETETPEEDQQSKTDITSKASATPTEDAENATEASPEQTSLDEFEQAILNAYHKAYKQARADIKAQQQAQAIARQFKGISKRTSRTKIQARRRPKAYK